MSFRKTIVAGLLAVTLVIGMIPVEASAKVTPEEVKAPQLVTSFHSVEEDSPMRQVEYYDITTDGMKLTVSGRTVEKYLQYRVCIRSESSSVFLFWHYKGTDNQSFGTPESDGSFSKTLDFTKEGNGADIPNGKYLLSVRFNKDGSDKFENEAQMRYIPIEKNDQGVFVLRYEAIAEFTEEIVAGETDSYQQLLKIHDYLCSAIYYDIPYNDAFEDEKREMAEDGKVMLNPYDLVKSLKNGTKTKTVCNGFSTLYAAMVRSLGIPCRTARGTSLRIPETSWETRNHKQLQEGTHVWNEVYLDGRWIFADNTKDCPNDYTAAEQYKYMADKLSKRCGFDASKQSIVQYILYTSYREEENVRITPQLTSATSKNRRVTFRWKKVKGAVRYYVFRSNDGMKYSLKKKISPKELTYKSGKLTKGKKYYWRIRAVMEDGSFSNFSNYKVVKVK